MKWHTPVLVTVGDSAPDNLPDRTSGIYRGLISDHDKGLYYSVLEVNVLVRRRPVDSTPTLREVSVEGCDLMKVKRWNVHFTTKQALDWRESQLCTQIESDGKEISSLMSQLKILNERRERLKSELDVRSGQLLDIKIKTGNKRKGTP